MTAEEIAETIRLIVDEVGTRMFFRLRLTPIVLVVL